MEQLTTVLISGGLITAFLEALKKALGAHFDWSRFGGLLALTVGVLTAIAGNELEWYPVQLSMGQAVFSGLMAGVTASGLNRGVTQNPPTVVVEGNIAAKPATPTEPSKPASTATAVIENPTVTDDAGAAGVSRSMEGSKPVARIAPPPPPS